MSTALLEAAVEGLRRRAVEPTVVRLGHGDVLDASTVESAEHLVFVYPTWWGGVPAMLLGPLHDLLGPWVDGDEAGSTSPLRSVQRLSVVTSYGGSRLINLAQGEAARHFWKRTVIRLCAPGAIHEVLALYGIVNASESELGAFLDRVRSKLSASA